MLKGSFPRRRFVSLSFFTILGMKQLKLSYFTNLKVKCLDLVVFF